MLKKKINEHINKKNLNNLIKMFVIKWNIQFLMRKAFKVSGNYLYY